MLIELIVNTALQWLVFLILPVICYLTFFKNKYPFSYYLGLKKPVPRSKLVIRRLVLVTSALSLTFFLFSYLLLRKYDIGTDDVRLVSYLETGWSIQTLVVIFLHSIVRTSFLEEIIFRGFLINTLSHKLTFNLANHIQSLIFTGIHILGMVQMGLHTGDILLSTLVIYVLSLLFGRLFSESNGSIVYSALFHGMANMAAALMLIL